MARHKSFTMRHYYLSPENWSGEDMSSEPKISARRTNFSAAYICSPCVYCTCARLNPQHKDILKATRNSWPAIMHWCLFTFVLLQNRCKYYLLLILLGNRTNVEAIKIIIIALTNHFKKINGFHVFNICTIVPLSIAKVKSLPRWVFCMEPPTSKYCHFNKICLISAPTIHACVVSFPIQLKYMYYEPMPLFLTLLLNLVLFRSNNLK